MRITLDLSGFDEGAVLECLKGLLRANVKHVRSGKLPLLLRSGVVYESEPAGSEVWLDAPKCLKLGAGDCEDLACWRAAELIVHGSAALTDTDPGVDDGLATIDARPFLRDWGTGELHCMVEYSIGGRRVTLDPSKDLGMRGVPKAQIARWKAAGVTPRAPWRPQ